MSNPTITALVALAAGVLFVTAGCHTIRRWRPATCPLRCFFGVSGAILAFLGFLLIVFGTAGVVTLLARTSAPLLLGE